MPIDELNAVECDPGDLGQTPVQSLESPRADCDTSVPVGIQSPVGDRERRGVEGSRRYLGVAVAVRERRSRCLVHHLAVDLDHQNPLPTDSSFSRILLAEYGPGQSPLDAPFEPGCRRLCHKKLCMLFRNPRGS